MTNSTTPESKFRGRIEIAKIEIVTVDFFSKPIIKKTMAPPPVILLISPQQYATKFMTQASKPTIAGRLKVRKVGEHGGFEVPVTISNPEYKEETALEGDGKKKKHLFGKKARKIIKGVTKAAEIGAEVAAITPSLEEFAPALVAASATGEIAGQGKKTKKKARYSLM